MSDNQAIEPAIDPSDIFYPTIKSEPNTPTDEIEDDTPSEDDSTDDSEVEAESVDDTEADGEETDAEEPEETSEDDDDTDEETLYLELDGEEFSLNEVRDWKSGAMMQADYTKKTQAHAEEVKVFNASREAFNTEKSKVGDLTLELEAMVAEDADVNWSELKEDDPEQYIELKEKADKRKAKVAELKADIKPVNTLTNDQLLAEKQDLFKANPSWLKDGELTKEYEADIKTAYDYAAKAGYSADELNGIVYSHHWKTLLDAAKFNAGKGKKKSVLDKKVKRAPLVTKPKKSQAKKQKSASDVFYGT